MQALPYLTVIPLFLLGAVLASFVGVVAGRIFTGTSWVTGRSRCDSCGEALGSLDLIPVASWILSLGRCRACSCRIPARYPLSEAILGTLFVLSYLKLGLSAPLLVFLGTLIVLAFIVLYDLRHTIVPPQASGLLSLLALCFAVMSEGTGKAFGATLLAAGLIGLGFFLLFLLSRGRAMGLGDAPVALSLSLLVGSSLAFSGLLFSFWIGALFGIAILVSRPAGHRMGIEVPFVPFLAAGYLLAFFTQWNVLFF